MKEILQLSTSTLERMRLFTKKIEKRSVYYTQFKQVIESDFADMYIKSLSSESRKMSILAVAAVRSLKARALDHITRTVENAPFLRPI